MESSKKLMLLQKHLVHVQQTPLLVVKGLILSMLNRPKGHVNKCN